MSSTATAIREYARDHARHTRAALMPMQQLPGDLAHPGESPLTALDAYVQHVLPVLPRSKLEGLARFFSSSLRRVGGGAGAAGVLHPLPVTPDALVSVACSSDAAAARFLACAAYYLTPCIGPVGFGQSTAALLLLKK